MVNNIISQTYPSVLNSIYLEEDLKYHQIVLKEIGKISLDVERCSCELQRTLKIIYFF